MIPEAEISRNYFPKIYEKDYTVGKLSEKKLFTDCQVLFSGNSTGCGKSKGAEYFLRIIQNLLLTTGEPGVANIKSGMGQQQAGDSAKKLKVTHQTNGHCTPMCDTPMYFTTTTGSNSKFHAGQFRIIKRRRALV